MSAHRSKLNVSSIVLLLSFSGTQANVGNTISGVSPVDNFDTSTISLSNVVAVTSPSTLSVVSSHKDCYSLGGNLDYLTQDQFVTHLTDSCRYDRLVRPPIEKPLNVSVQIDLRHVEAFDQLQFKTHMLVQYRYTDNRLKYEDLSPTRGIILGEELLRDRIWIPHIVLDNERDTKMMGIEGKDVFVSISPNGEIVFSYRMTATIYCWMDLRKFPFDSQTCSIKLKSWTYNASNLMLIWENNDPVKVASQLHLTEFVLNSYWISSKMVEATLPRSVFVGNFSMIVFEFKLDREIGYYLLDYFIPSIMIVCTSWVTFYLQADASAPRAILGTQTMLNFITLSTKLSQNLPKVSYVKANDIWFFGITIFIFGSMAEFALVNMIWRRKKDIELKKMKSKYILKSSITPKLAKKELQRSSSGSHLYRSRLGEHGHLGSTTSLSTVRRQHRIETNNSGGIETIVEPVPDYSEESGNTSWATMTPHEVSNWIDKKSRIVFPIAFVIFNAFYWTFVYLL